MSKPSVKALLAKKKAPVVPDKCPECSSGLVQTRTTRQLVCRNYECDFWFQLA